VPVLVLGSGGMRMLQILAMRAMLVLMLVLVVAAVPMPVLVPVAVRMAVLVRMLVRVLGSVLMHVLVHMRVNMLVLMIMSKSLPVRVRVTVGPGFVLGCAAAILTHSSSFAMQGKIPFSL
jgi:hypothetical protein